MYSFLRLILATCVLFAASLSGCMLSAQDMPDRPILRSVYGDFYPYSYTATDGRAEGYNIDLTRQLADQAGYDVVFTPASNPKEFFALLERGEIDLTPLLALTPEREEMGLATSALGQYDLSVYVRSDSDISTINALSGRTVGVVTGSLVQTAAAMIPFVEVREFQTSDALILPLLSGQIDAVVAVVEPFEALLRRNFVKDKMQQLEPSLTILPYGLFVRRDLPQVHAELERVIVRYADPQTLGPLRNRWFGKDRGIVEHPWFERVAMIVGGIGLATVSLGIYAVRLRRRSARLLAENDENQLLIDALDQIRAGVVIFDREMLAVHWNNGFENQFPDMVPLLREGVNIEGISLYVYDRNLARSGVTKQENIAAAAKLARQLRKGITEQGIVTTPLGDTFDLSMFRLGTGHYAAIWMDVTQLQRQQEHIASQSVELERKNSQLLAFSAMAAHDLKAPLLQQAALMEFILEDVADADIALPAEVQRHFGMLSDLSGRMNALVRDLLEYAKADNVQAKTLCFLPETRLEAVLKLSGGNRNIKITVVRGMPAVQVEPNAFDMVMRNLVSNAIKHHDKPLGQITLRAKRVEDMVLIDVEDDGPGIATQHRNSVFDPFCRLTNVEGTGLGLAFVKKTVLAWGGQVTLRPAAERGCIFRVTLPAAPDNVIALTAQQGEDGMPFDQQKAIGTS